MSIEKNKVDDTYKKFNDGRFRLCQELRTTVFYFKQHLEHQNGGNQEIVLEPKTGTVEMRTLNLQYALTAKGLRATDECDFYMDRTLNTIDYKGELTGDSVYYNPEADWKDSEWETTGPQALYLGQNMTGSIQVGNDRYEVKEGTFDDGKARPDGNASTVPAYIGTIRMGRRRRLLRRKDQSDSLGCCR